MTADLGFVLALLATAIVMFAIGRPRMDAVALLMLTALPLTGVLSMSEALAGFSDGNIVLIAALFVIGDGLVRTGVARRLGDWLTATAGSSESRLIALLMVVVCGLGATMSSTAVTAIFIPVVLRIAQRSGIAVRRLMMPLSAAALISGMTTLVATAPNLVVNSELIHFLERQGQANPVGFHFFSFTPFGVPVLVLGVVYMLIARRWLGGADAKETNVSSAPTLSDWVEEYQLADREHRVRVRPGSPLAGKKIGEIPPRDVFGATLIAIQRGREMLQPRKETRLQPGDILLIDLCAGHDEIESLRKKFQLEALPLSGVYFTDRSQEIGMAEVILPDNSDLVGQTVAEARLRDRTELTVIGLRRGEVARKRDLQYEKLKLGDTLLLIGPWNAIQNVQQGGTNMVLLSVPVEHADVLPAAGKAPQALACLALVIGLMVSGVIPNVQAALIGCLLMAALGCVSPASVYRSIDWKTILLIVGMLPFSIALQRTGGVDLASNSLMAVTSGAGTYAVLLSLFAITAILGMFISNTATAVLMAPVSLGIADKLDASPYPFAMIVALAASTAFMTPVSSPVNTLVVGPGDYTFGDFIRIGVPFSLIVMVVSVLLVPWLLPL